jgi:hypothetical protein
VEIFLKVRYVGLDAMVEVIVCGYLVTKLREMQYIYVHLGIVIHADVAFSLFNSSQVSSRSTT